MFCKAKYILIKVYADEKTDCSINHYNNLPNVFKMLEFIVLSLSKIKLPPL